MHSTLIVTTVVKAFDTENTPKITNIFSGGFPKRYLENWKKFLHNHKKQNSQSSPLPQKIFE